jgi:predicted DsbA family dithiol-disulfide isomerase
MPFSDTEIIWFNQFDTQLVDQPLEHPQDLASFTKNVLKDFPPVIHELLNATDFSTTYLWNTRDFDPLPSFHVNNVVLMGDAAHLAVPFTSAGVTNALFDADQLAMAMEEYPQNITRAFERFYQKRIEAVSEHLELGRKLKYDFLHPQQIDDDHIELPLIKKSILPPPSNARKDIQIIYFTDPICSTCWTIQPQLRKLRATYGNSIDFKYVMAGLLPSWENFNRWGITSPSDVYHHWSDESAQSGMPIDPSVWMKDPLQSSYSPSIAFKAAQLQDIDKSILLLRRMNELIFIESGNITRLDVLKKAAYDVGLDAARLMRDLEKSAVQFFNEDLQMTREMGINLLPTFIFKVNNEIKDYLVGAQTYESFERAILKLNPLIIKKDLKLSAIEVFSKYPSITKKEFKFLTNTNDAEAELILSELLKKAAIRQLITPNGHVLLSKNEASLLFHPGYVANAKTG